MNQFLPPPLFEMDLVVVNAIADLGMSNGEPHLVRWALELEAVAPKPNAVELDLAQCDVTDFHVWKDTFAIHAVLWLTIDFEPTVHGVRYRLKKGK